MTLHFKCVDCRIRLYRAAGSDDLVGDLCPGCGSFLEPVGELAEIVGFRSIKFREGAADDSLSGRHQRIADGLDDFFARPRAKGEPVKATAARPA